MEKAGITAHNSLVTLTILETARDGVIRGGESGIFSPLFLFSRTKVFRRKRLTTVKKVKHILQIFFCADLYTKNYDIKGSVYIIQRSTEQEGKPG